MIDLLIESAFRALLMGLVVGLALKLTRTKNPHVEMTVWSGVLGGALAMPALMQLSGSSLRISLPLLYRYVLHLAAEAPAAASLAEPVSVAGSATGFIPDWRGGAMVLYAAVAMVMLGKLLLGLWASRRLIRQAVSVEAGGRDVRISKEVAVPITIGRTVLVPAEFPAWDAKTRQAVLAHEGAHARRGDFYLLFVAGIHKAVFWFSPLSWWLHARLAQLAEAASDDAAIEQLGDRPSYAEILLDFARRPNRALIGMEMARPAGIAGRVDRVLEETAVAQPPSRKWKTLAAFAAMPMLLVPACLSLTARAEVLANNPAPQKKAIDVTSEEGIDFSKESRTITAHHGKAVLDGNVAITGDSVIIDYIDGKSGSETSHIRTSGNVQVSLSANNSVSGDQADYSAETDKITVSGKVKWINGGQQINGGRAVIDPAKDIVRVYPN